MIEDVYNPVQKFRSEFRDKFKEVAEQTFEDLLKHSGLDVEANKETIAMEQGDTFAIREGGRTVGSGRVVSIVE